MTGERSGMPSPDETPSRAQGSGQSETQDLPKGIPEERALLLLPEEQEGRAQATINWH